MTKFNESSSDLRSEFWSDTAYGSHWISYHLCIIKHANLLCHIQETKLWFININKKVKPQKLSVVCVQLHPSGIRVSQRSVCCTGCLLQWSARVSGWIGWVQLSIWRWRRSQPSASTSLPRKLLPEWVGVL